MDFLAKIDDRAVEFAAKYPSVKFTENTAQRGVINYRNRPLGLTDVSLHNSRVECTNETLDKK
ncbi:hypothetical protein JYU34_003337, partial [Plutella xylostella]